MFADRYENILQLLHIYRVMNVFLFESVYSSSFPSYFRKNGGAKYIAGRPYLK